MSPVERSEKFGALVGGDANVMVGNLKANQVLSLGADANMDFKSQPARPSCPNQREPVTGVTGSRSVKEWRCLPLTRTLHKPLTCAFASKLLL